MKVAHTCASLKARPVCLLFFFTSLRFVLSFPFSLSPSSTFHRECSPHLPWARLSPIHGWVHGRSVRVQRSIHPSIDQSINFLSQWNHFFRMRSIYMSFRNPLVCFPFTPHTFTDMEATKMAAEEGQRGNERVSHSFGGLGSTGARHQVEGANRGRYRV